MDLIEIRREREGERGRKERFHTSKRVSEPLPSASGVL